MSVQEIIIAIAPYIATIITFIGVIARVLNAFTKLKKEVVDLKALDEIKDQLSEVLRENAQLKKKLNETMTKIDHIRRD